MQHQKIRIEIHAALAHQVQHAVIEHGSVLDRRATGQHCGPRAVGGMGMHYGPQALHFGLAARCLNLRVADRLLTAISNASGGE